MTDRTSEKINSAITFEQLGEYQKAEDIYRAILGNDPENPDVNHKLGRLLLATSRAVNGLDYIKKALVASPEDSQYWLSFIDALLAVGRPWDAKEILDDLLAKGLKGSDVDILSENVFRALEGKTQKTEKLGRSNLEAPAEKQQHRKKTVKKQNVLLITIDGLRSDHLGCYGRKPDPSPFLNKIIEESVQAPITYSMGCPTEFSLSSLLTSTRPLDFGGYENGLLGRPTSWLGMLKLAGYRTVSFNTQAALFAHKGIGGQVDDFYHLIDLVYLVDGTFLKRVKWFLNLHWNYGLHYDYTFNSLKLYFDRFIPSLKNYCLTKLKEAKELPYNHHVFNRDYLGLAQLFEKEDRRYHKDQQRYIDEVIKGGCEVLPFYYLGSRINIDKGKPSSAYVFECFRQWLARLGKDQNFGAWLHVLDVHDSFNEYTYRARDLVLPFEVERSCLSRVEELYSKIESEKEYKGSYLYDLGLTYVDFHIERLFEALRHQGVFDDTLVAISSDHGIPAGYPQRQTGLWNFHEELYRVPLAFHHNSLVPQKKRGIATTMDIAPTILDFLGIDIPNAYQGQSFLNARYTENELFVTENLGSGPCDFNLQSMNICVLQCGKKLTYKISPQNAGASGQVVSFYDLNNDPMEEQNHKDNPAYINIIKELEQIARARHQEIFNSL